MRAGGGVVVPTMQERARPAPAGVDVLSRKSVGALDTVVLAASEPRSLRRWLEANDFHVPDSIEPVVADYVNEGWLFVASKLARESDDGDVRRVRPLAFTFPTAEAVYPMRLTGAVNESLALELFVLGASRADVAGLEVVCCTNSLESDLDTANDGWSTTTELRRRGLGAKVLTRLTGSLDRDAMSRDLAIRWTAYARTSTTYVTSGVALLHSAAIGAGAFAFVLVGAAARRRVRRWKRPRSSWRSAWRDLAGATAVGVAAFGVAWFLQPRLPPSGHAVQWRREEFPFPADKLPTEPIRDLATARAWAAERAAGCINPLTDEPVREEDSPGNYTIREECGRVELVLYVVEWRRVMQHALDLSSAPRPRRHR